MSVDDPNRRSEQQKNVQVAALQWVAAVQDHAAPQVRIQVDAFEPTHGRSAAAAATGEAQARLTPTGATLVASAQSDDMAFSLWSITYERDGETVTEHQIAMRRWVDGKMESERIVNFQPGVESD